MDKKEIIAAIEKMSVVELNDLVKALEEKFEVTAQPLVGAGMGAVPGQAGQPEPAAEKTSFDVVLKSAGDKKIQVIKTIREIVSLGLKESKELVDKAPTAVKEEIAKEEAEEIKKKLEAAGATVEIK